MDDAVDGSRGENKGVNADPRSLNTLDRSVLIHHSEQVRIWSSTIFLFKH